MKTAESNSQTDYLYYPIEYTTNVFSTLLTLNTFPGEETWIQWLVSIDKSKFLDGLATDYSAQYGKPIRFNVISVGF